MSAVLSAFFASPTVQTALVVGTVVAVVSSVVGVFTITRGQSFAGHALADLGAVGGSGAFLLGVSQLWGFVLAGVISAVAMEAIGTRRLEGRDVATGIVFGAGMGLTALFLTLDTLIGGSSNAAISVLFGSLFSLDSALVPVIVALGVVTLAIMTAIWRWVHWRPSTAILPLRAVSPRGRRARSSSSPSPSPSSCRPCRSGRSSRPHC